MDAETRLMIMRRLPAARLICKPLQDYLPCVALLSLYLLMLAHNNAPTWMMGHVGALAHYDTLTSATRI
jgi:hypothetical protein